MPANKIPLAKEIGRVPSVTVPLDNEQERRYQRLMDEVIMIDVHQHPMVLPEDLDRFTEYLRSNNYKWG
jgi:membrane dipeptidase